MSETEGSYLGQRDAAAENWEICFDMYNAAKNRLAQTRHHLRKANKGCRRAAIMRDGYRRLYERYRDSETDLLREKRRMKTELSNERSTVNAALSALYWANSCPPGSSCAMKGLLTECGDCWLAHWATVAEVTE